MKSVQIQNFSGLYFPAFGLNKEIYGVSVRIQNKCKKITDWKFSVYGHSHAVSIHLKNCV